MPELSLHNDVMMSNAQTRFSDRVKQASTEQEWKKATNILFTATNFLRAATKTPLYANSEPAKARKLPSDSFYLVSAFPFTESQVFDLQNSFRSQTTILLNLAATYLQAGYKVDAENLTRFVKRVEKDLATRTHISHRRARGRCGNSDLPL
jgi:hypothetical protein